MFPLETLIILGVVMLITGAVIGVVVGRTWVPSEQQRDLEHRLVSAKEELDEYQQDVAKHFMATSKKVSDLTQSYRDLHEHLATGALRLTSTEIGKELIDAGDTRAQLHQVEYSHIQPPKDWAPKTPGSHGMLSEEFGLSDHESSEPAATPEPDNAKKP